MGFPAFFYNQIIVKPSLPATSFANQTIIVTGSSTKPGLGREAARHIARLGAGKIILAVRNTSAGEIAKQDIESSTNRPGVCEVWELDLASYDSVLAFAEKALQLARLDVLVNNAAVATKIFSLANTEHESPGVSLERSLTVNNISHFLLTLLLLPKLRQTAKDFPDRENPPYVTFLTSQSHAWPQFPQRNDTRGILKGLSDPATARMDERYPLTKMVATLWPRELVARLAGAENDPSVIITLVETGFCDTRLSRENQGYEEVAFDFFKKLFARTAEVGARTTVAAVSGGPETHGKYMVNGVVAEEALGGLAVSEEGKGVQRRLWEEIREVLEGVRPGVLRGVGL
ncbi:hypothetical protein BJX70DRAFT_396748 [Aspergillus crustosus]